VAQRSAACGRRRRRRLHSWPVLFRHQYYTESTRIGIRECLSLLYGSAGGSTTLPFGGLLAANINADVYLTDVSLAYTFKPTFLGAHYTAAVAVPYVWMDVEATVALNPRLFRKVIGNRTKP
jgi:hypothetical protein